MQAISARGRHERRDYTLGYTGLGCNCSPSLGTLVNEPTHQPSLSSSKLDTYNYKHDEVCPSRSQRGAMLQELLITHLCKENQVGVIIVMPTKERQSSYAATRRHSPLELGSAGEVLPCLGYRAHTELGPQVRRKHGSSLEAESLLLRKTWELCIRVISKGKK